MTYIYLNEYKNGYLYIGSHTWDGPAWKLDPNYHGSSAVARHKGWHPIRESILEVVTEEKFIRERYWIEKYAEQYGIADCAAMFSKSKGWINKFPQHGRMLNAHANNCKQAIANSHTKESIKKRKDSGGYMFDMKQCHSKEAYTKSFVRRKAEGSIRKWIDAAHTPEINIKRALARRKSARKVLCPDGFAGCVSDLSEHLCISRSLSSKIISNTYKSGNYTWKGLKFRVYEEMLHNKKS